MGILSLHVALRQAGTEDGPRRSTTRTVLGGGGGILSLHVALRQAGIEHGPRRSKCPPRGSHRRALAFPLFSPLQNPHPILPYAVQVPFEHATRPGSGKSDLRGTPDGSSSGHLERGALPPHLAES